MKNELYGNILDYWRNNLADAARVEVPVDKSEHVREAVIDLAAGMVDLVQANGLIDAAEVKKNNAKGIDDKASPDWMDIDQVSVLIAVFHVSPVPEHTKYTGERGTFYPFWIPALMNRAGRLETDEETFPYIPRPYLEPQINQDVNFILSGIEEVDTAFASIYRGKNWPDYWEYVNALFQNITGLPFMQYAADGFQVNYSPVIVANDTLPNAADGIIHLYDHLRQNSDIPQLLQRLCEREPAPLAPLLTMDEMETYCLLHLGQMGHEYALSISQRKTLYHFLTQQTGDVLAINGPPGTGKTTLLQSVVANEVVAGALEGKTPRIILASSTNNQAVTNIIESFSNVKVRDGILYQRWLPKVKGFALFLPSKGREVKDDIPCYRLGGAYPGGLEDREYIATAREHYLAQFAGYTGIKALTVEEAIGHLQGTLKEYRRELEDGLRLWKDYKEKLPALLRQLGTSEEINWQTGELDQALLEKIGSALKELEGEVNNYFDSESIWIKLFSFLPFIKEKRVRRLKQVFRDGPLEYSSVDFYRSSSIHQYFAAKFRLIKDIRMLDTNWQGWKNKLDIKGNPPLSETQCRELSLKQLPYFYDELEKGLKNELFYLAIHYWEGRWLIETEEVIEEDGLRKKGRPHAERRWQRFAMLTPCLVANFYMAPKFFQYSKFIQGAPPGNQFETPPLYELADLLIVDEAGQVSPEIGAATFALAKRALVVGDTQQIEPVWNILPKVDYANLYRCGLISREDDYKAIDDWHSKGYLCSSGSIMKLAQKSSCFKVHPDVETGMYLTEHRRCFDEIIGYCNKIAYKGLLEPMKGPAKNTLLPPMAFVDVDGASEIRNSSRKNQAEADAIADWIMHKGNSIVRHYQLMENARAEKEGRPPAILKLHDLIGIITPFTAQKWAVKAALAKSGIDANGLTIGTVHALQGAERPLVLFSSVYGSNNAGSRFFFDKGVNMLNVAVSRAKDSFIMFGSNELYDKNNKSYSGQLYRYIKGLNGKS